MYILTLFRAALPFSCTLSYPAPPPSATRDMYKQHAHKIKHSGSVYLMAPQPHTTGIDLANYLAEGNILIPRRIRLLKPIPAAQRDRSEAAGGKYKWPLSQAQSSQGIFGAATVLLPLAFLWQTRRPINKATRVYRRDGGRYIQKGKAQEKIKGVRVKP